MPVSLPKAADPAASSIFGRLFEFQLVFAFISLVSTDIVAIQMDRLRQMQILDQRLFDVFEHMYGWVFISLLVTPLVVIAILRLSSLSPSARRVWCSISTIPAAIWLIFILGLVALNITTVREIHLKTGIDDMRINTMLSRSGIPAALVLQSGVEGWTVYVNAKYLSQAKEICGNDAR